MKHLFFQIIILLVTELNHYDSELFTPTLGSWLKIGSVIKLLYFIGNNNVFTQPLNSEQDATLIQFLNNYSWFEFRVFLFLNGLPNQV